VCLQSNAHTEACVIAAAPQAVGLLPGQLVSSHSRITDALAAMSHADPSTPSFDLAVLEVIEALEGHSKVCLDITSLYY
jgi:hypothetical protein